jgi:predicted hotdog family 3-hydroxylacyl-ACP dehydratase
MAYPNPAELLPHAGPAVLIDEIIRDTDDGIEAASTITAAHPFFVAGHGVPAWVGIELMAQAIAAHSGLAGQRTQRAPRRGMLLGTRHYQGHVAWFAEGARLAIHAVREFGHEGGMAACQCRIEAAGKTLAEATLIIIEENAA